jgi:heterodisulfide reductase subunit C
MGENANLCYQCKKCSVGCPLLYEMDYVPHQIVHAIRLGLQDLVLKSQTIWLCVACETCTTRCPQGVDIVKIMDAARIFTTKYKVAPGIKEIPAFHKSVLQIIKIFGRLYEFGVIMLLKFRTGNFTQDINLGLKLIRIGKLSLMPDFSTILKINKMFSKALKMERKSL